MPEQAEQINCRLLYTGKLSDNPGWQFPSHKHDDIHEIVMIQQGLGQFMIDGIHYTAGAGDILFFNQGVLHEESSSSENPLFTYYCGFQFLADSASHQNWVIPPDREPIIRSNRYSPAVASLMKLLFEESSIQAAHYMGLSQRLLESILILVKRMVHDESSVSQKINISLAAEIKEFLDKNFAQNLSLKEIAKQFHINSYYVSHLFKNHYHISPINYLIHRRMGEAARLLTTTQLKVWEIGRLVGYESATYFSIMFNRITGQSPKQFRDNHEKTHYIT